MTSAIDFYFDFSSPYGYFASTRIESLAAKYGRSVVWHPILLGAVFKTTGSVPLPELPLKGPYSLRDFARSARFHGIPYNPPEELPITTLNTARAMLWIQQRYGAAKAVEFCKTAYRAYFIDGIHIGEAENVVRVAVSMDIDGGALSAGMSDAAIKNALRTEVEQAMAKGVFGSPFMIVDDEPFWGFDRFDQLEAFLKNGKI
jgi:2-hydroxychromene-2-carboxylate isomerase